MSPPLDDDFATLDSLSATVALALFEAFPHWRAHARSHAADDGSRFLVVTVPAPSAANVEHGLTIDTEAREITVGFDVYHAHFDAWSPDASESATRSALEFVRGIVDETLSVASYWFDAQWRGSMPLPAGAEPLGGRWAGDRGVNRVRVRSWNGAFNAEFAL